MEFQCPNCGNNKIRIIREKKISNILRWEDDSVDFDYDSEKVSDVTDIFCSKCDYVLTLQSGFFVTDFNTFKKWVQEQNLIKEEGFYDPFSLYHIGFPEKYSDEEINRAKEVSTFLKKILNKLVKDIIELGASNPTFRSRYNIVMTPVAAQVRALNFAGVGVGDTSTDECICTYIEEQLRVEYETDKVDEMGLDFYTMIHK